MNKMENANCIHSKYLSRNKRDHYSPYYYGNYFTASQYGHYQYLNTNYNSNNYDSYLSGNRGNLTSNTSVRTITNNSNYITNNIKKNSTINIRSNSLKNSEIRTNTNKTPIILKFVFK